MSSAKIAARIASSPLRFSTVCDSFVILTVASQKTLPQRKLLIRIRQAPKSAGTRSPQQVKRVAQHSTGRQSRYQDCPQFRDGERGSLAFDGHAKISAWDAIFLGREGRQ